jgi:hypothetical protein
MRRAKPTLGAKLRGGMTAFATLSVPRISAMSKTLSMGDTHMDLDILEEDRIDDG